MQTPRPICSPVPPPPPHPRQATTCAASAACPLTAAPPTPSSPGTTRPWCGASAPTPSTCSASTGARWGGRGGGHRLEGRSAAQHACHPGCRPANGAAASASPLRSRPRAPQVALEPGGAEVPLLPAALGVQGGGHGGHVRVDPVLHRAPGPPPPPPPCLSLLCSASCPLKFNLQPRDSAGHSRAPPAPSCAARCALAACAAAAHARLPAGGGAAAHCLPTCVAATGQTGWKSPSCCCR